MKGGVFVRTFSRVFSTLLLIVLLCTFTMWRNDAFPDMSAITQLVQDTAGRLQTLTEIDPEDVTSPPRSPDEGAEFPEYALSEPLDPELEALICNAYRNHTEHIDLSAYQMKPEDLQNVISAIHFSYPEFFYLGSRINYIPNEQNIVQEYKPEYLYDAATTATMMNEYNAMVDAIVAKCPQTGGDFAKLLYVHDHFVQNYSYDKVGLANNNAIRDAYSFFKYKTGVCQAYMLAMIAVCDDLGIESIPVTSAPMKHAWNMVKLNGAWYHVDVTWDDVDGYPSYTSYRYFLQSDAGMIAIDKDKAEGHRDWEATEKATTVTYDTAIWHESNTPMLLNGGQYYCVVYETDPADKNVSGVVYSGADPVGMSRSFTVKAKWTVAGSGGTQDYLDCYTGLAIYNGKLIYNTQNTLRAHDLTTGADTLLGFLSLDADKSVYGIVGISGNTVSCVVASAPKGAGYATVTYTITP